MKMKNWYKIFIWLFIGMCISCTHKSLSEFVDLDEEVSIFPDIKDVTIPCNIAPLNFNYNGEEKDILLLVSGRNGEKQFIGDEGCFHFKRNYWKNLLHENKGDKLVFTIAVCRDNKWYKYKPFEIYVSSDSIDPYISYRLIPPGYEGWRNMGIYQRNLESFDEKAIIENKLTNYNCVNCHSYCQRNPNQMIFHSRAEFDGTVLINDSILDKLNTKTNKTMSSLVYPYWHPSGNYIAFSVNKTKQNFYNSHPNRVEVYDEASDVVVYDINKHEIFSSDLLKSVDAFETFPTFSPDGKSLFFCSARAVDTLTQNYNKVKYSLCRIDFDEQNQSFGSQVDTVYNAETEGKSVSFPRISPDGKYLVFTLHDYGNFSIWHKEADLYLYDLSSQKIKSLDVINSNDVESYHSWSDNSRWMIFSSRRLDGLYTRLFITHINTQGEASRPFLLPQSNPLEYYKDLMYSYNIPEFMLGPVDVSKYKIVDLLRNTKAMSIKYQEEK